MEVALISSAIDNNNNYYYYYFFFQLKSYLQSTCCYKNLINWSKHYSFTNSKK